MAACGFHPTLCQMSRIVLADEDGLPCNIIGICDPQADEQVPSKHAWKYSMLVEWSRAWWAANRLMSDEASGLNCFGEKEIGSSTITKLSRCTLRFLTSSVLIVHDSSARVRAKHCPSQILGPSHSASISPPGTD